MNKNNNYYPDSQKKYRSKIKQYNIKFSLSDDDMSIVNFLENEREELGLTANSYLKGILTEYVNSKYKE